LQKTDVVEVPYPETALTNAEAERSDTENTVADDDHHLAQEHGLKRMVAYVREKPKTPGTSARKGSAIRMERFRANRNAEGLVQAYMPADIFEIAKNEDGGWETMRAAIAIGRRALALRGWRAKVVTLLLPRA
jgi:hypothetical protein